MHIPFCTTVVFLFSFVPILIHAGRGLHPDPDGHWISYTKGHFWGQYQVARELSPSELANWLVQVKDDMLEQMQPPLKHEVVAIPFAISAYMGEKGILAVASSTGQGLHTEEVLATQLGSKFYKGSCLAFLFPGGPTNVAPPGSFAGACAGRCKALLEDKRVTDVFRDIRRRAQAFNA